MTEEWMLTVADVAEVLGTSREKVAGFIARCELPVAPGRKVRITHTAVVEFVNAMQRDALTLGREPDFVASIVGSQPSAIVDDNHPEC
jgi:excisionase family DNA binding protein